MVMNATLEGIIQLIDSLKRITISVLILCFAWYATSSSTIPTEYGGIWIGFAGSVVGFYLGSRTTSQAQEANK